ncbi:MAG TPA: serine/threonine-protein kinase [Thermoanaerobaculia bacterium]|nr:serine/threonine-protein kinase [Thermoanaerobaculia bacterium]
MAKPKLLALLTRDHRALAEQQLAAGHKDKAAQLFLRAGDFDQAARLAAEIGDERLAVEAALRATLGEVPEGYAAAGAQQAAELLAIKSHHREAAELFELARAWRQAAEAALKLQQPARAARLYERGRMWSDAALYYGRAGLAEDELRVLKLESERRREGGRAPAAGQDATLQSIELRRAELLRRLGKGAESASLLREAAPTAQTGRLLEQAGEHEQAVNAYLAAGEAEQAVRLLGSQPGIDRRLAAEVYLRCGQPLAAAQILAALGLSRESAEAYEAGGDWGRAGSRWEAAGDSDRAAHAYLRGARTRDAGRCFATAGKPNLAAAAYAKAGDHEAAAAQHLRAGQPVAAAGELLAAHAAQAAQAAQAAHGSNTASGAGNQRQAASHQAAAAKLLLDVLPGSPDHEAATLLLVPLLLEQGLREDALRRLRALPPVTAGGLAPAAAAAFRQRLLLEGRALEELGEVSQAEACCRQLLAVEPGQAEAAQRLQRLLQLQSLQSLRAGQATAAEAASAAVAAVAASAASAAAAAAMAAVSGAAGGAGAAPPPRAVAPGEAAGGGARLGDTTLREGPPRPAAAAAPAAPAAVQQVAIGQLLADRYEILAELGRGGMGRVYQAFDRELGEPVAIKTLLGQPDDGSNDAERLLRELQICRKITHPNVLRVFDFGRFPGGIFLTMELLEGERLDHRISRQGPLPAPLAQDLLCEVTAGLEEAHALGIVHRDLKPSNIFLTPLRLKILDFGIARQLGSDTRLTATGFAVGSPAYMSPEQLQGLPLDGRSDLYALGVLAFVMLAGREPFAGATAAALALQHLQQPPPDLRRLRPDLPAGWPELVATLLAKRPADRFGSAAEVGRALAALPVTSG